MDNLEVFEGGGVFGEPGAGEPGAVEFAGAGGVGEVDKAILGKAGVRAEVHQAGLAFAQHGIEAADRFGQQEASAKEAKTAGAFSDERFAGGEPGDGPGVFESFDEGDGAPAGGGRGGAGGGDRAGGYTDDPGAAGEDESGEAEQPRESAAKCGGQGGHGEGG